ncbi:MAG: class I SAM-dependent methyltransferase [Deltaproteobacteria bacterium]|nr:class I SAM-dependent methyltransferase [Deltaproteobacteria bacterium]
MMDAQFWAKAWEEARRDSSLYAKPTDPKKWEDFWNLFSKSYARRNRDTQTFQDTIISRLQAQGVFNERSLVLDIGCGPGTYTLPLARHCRKVTGLDTAKEMLETLQNEARLMNVADRIEVDSRDWADFPDQPRFDVAVGANTPAIRDFQSLMKMNSVSRAYGCLINYAGRVTSTLRDGLWGDLVGSTLTSRAFDLQYPFNILYQEGYWPNILFFPYSHTVTEPLDYLILHFTCYFRIFGKEGLEVEEQIRRYLEQRVEDGLVEDIQKGAVSVIWWRSEKSP